MDPDISKKVTDLLGLAEGISNDIDVRAELDKIASKVLTIEEKVEVLTKKLEKIEALNRQKQDVIKAIKSELKGIYSGK